MQVTINLTKESIDAIRMLFTGAAQPAAKRGPGRPPKNRMETDSDSESDSADFGSDSEETDNDSDSDADAVDTGTKRAVNRITRAPESLDENGDEIETRETEDEDEEEADEAPAPKAAKANTIDTVREALRAYAKKNGRDKALGVLKKFGVKSVQELKPKQFSDLIARLKK